MALAFVFGFIQINWWKRCCFCSCKRYVYKRHSNHSSPR